MDYTWFKIFNETEFLALGLTSKTYTLELEGLGQKDILVTNGVAVGITYEGIFLPLRLNAINPFKFEDHAVYVDSNEDVYLGIAVDEA